MFMRFVMVRTLLVAFTGSLESSFGIALSYTFLEMLLYTALICLCTANYMAEFNDA